MTGGPSKYNPNKYEKLRNEEENEFNFGDSDEEIPTKPTPAKIKKQSSLRSLNQSKIKNIVKKETTDILNENRQELQTNNAQAERSQPLVDFYLKMKKNFKDINKDKGDPVIGKSSFVKSTNKNVSEIHTHLPTSWTLPEQFQSISDSQILTFLKHNGIQIDGLDLPPPIKSFSQLKLPKYILKHLQKSKIYTPTPVQSQSMPIVLSGRDLVATSYAGSGKTLCYILPIICFAIQQQKCLEIQPGEGPLFLILTPSRELAEQIYTIFLEYITLVEMKMDLKLNACLAIGGISLHEQLHKILQGIHILIATPGRLNHLLSLGKGVNLSLCQLFCIDGADILSDRFFVEELEKIVPKMPEMHQTLLFSTSNLSQIPNIILKSFCNSPAVVSILRTNAPKINQDFIMIENQNKLPILLQALQKTAPPVLIFTFLKEDVDTITEYLLLKGVNAVSLHADKLQSERSESLKLFNSGKKDVLVASDIASRGLDFKNIKHVINYELPEEFDSYISRIGRTGRHNNKGLATTLVDKGSNIVTLIEVKKYLLECKLPIPLFMDDLKSGNH